MEANAEEAKKQPPKVDWKEFIQLDRLYPLLTRAEQMQVLEKVEIQPDPNGQVAGLAQVRDVLASQSKEKVASLKAQTEQQGLALTANKQRLDAQKNDRDHRVRVAETLISAKEKNSKNDNLQN
jgi:hypothetical protein